MTQSRSTAAIRFDVEESNRFGAGAPGVRSNFSRRHSLSAQLPAHAGALEPVPGRGDGPTSCAGRVRAR